MATTSDTSAPTIIRISPKDESINLPLTAYFTIDFSESILRGTGKITLRKADGTIVESYDVATNRTNLDVSLVSIKVIPSTSLLPGTAYYLEIDQGAFKDVAGNPFAGLKDYNITTAPAANDTTAPTAISFSPSDGASGVTAETNIKITFSEAIKRGSGNIVLKVADGAVIESFDAQTSARLVYSANTLTIDPSPVLSEGKTYVLEIPKGAVLDTAGNPYAGTTSYDFTVGAGGQTPGNNTGDGTAPTLKSAKYEEVNGSGSVVLEFSESVKLASGYSLELKTANGELVQGFNTFSALLYGDHRVDDNKIILALKTRLQEGISYHLSVAKGVVQDLAGNGFDGLANYVISGKSDVVPPEAIEFAPGNAASNVALDASLRVKFSEPIKIGYGKIKLKVEGGDAVNVSEGSSNYNVSIDGSVLTIKPSKSYLPATRYSLEFEAGAIVDMAGNPAGALGYVFSTSGVSNTPSPGNDRILAQAGSETINALAGIDTVIFSGPRGDYSIQRKGADLIVTDNKGNGGVDTLISVERLVFADNHRAFDLSPTESAGKAALFIGALAPQYLKDAKTVGTILYYFDNGYTLETLSQLAIDTGLVRALAGSNSNADLAALIFRSMTGAEPSQAFLSMITPLMERYSQAEFIAVMAASELNQKNVNLVGLQDTGLLYMDIA